MSTLILLLTAFNAASIALSSKFSRIICISSVSYTHLFVSVPVVLAAGHKHIPVIIHESDMTPGLANRIAIKKATKVCCNFPETIKYLPADKAVLTGSPIRQELLQGNKLAGLKLCNFTSGKPIIMVVGGSTGAVHVNEAVRKVLPELLKDYQVVHLCGKGKKMCIRDRKIIGLIIKWCVNRYYV